ncbi:MAG: alcohol dehydrogenase catalytic domain-containing protein [Gammaproteobacteria bacterium]
MRGICFEAVEHVAVRQLNDPIIEQSTDAIVAIDVAGLCGSDLHPYFGRETGLDAGTVMGHEFVGTVVETGRDVASLALGDRVFSPFSTSCGRCYFCRNGLTSRCLHGQLLGWRQGGEGLHGAQAEYIRIPLADGTLLPIPSGMGDDTALLLGDNLSTGFFCANNLNIQADCVYAVVGCGTVGLLAIASALRLGATRVLAIDPAEDRLKMASMLGAEIFSDESAFVEGVLAASAGRGADGVMEVVGLPAAQRLAYEVVRPGGTLSVVGCHCTPHFAFSPAEAYDKNLTYRTGRCPARHYMALLANQLAQSPMDLGWCITDRFSLDEAEHAYTVFGNRTGGCIKATIDIRE